MEAGPSLAVRRDHVVLRRALHERHELLGWLEVRVLIQLAGAQVELGRFQIVRFSFRSLYASAKPITE